MKRFALALAALLALVTLAPAAPPEAAPPPKLVLKTGAKPTPKHVIASSPRFQKSGKIGAPAQYAAIPKRMSMWGNDQYGDCVTAEECFAKITDNPNCFITEQQCVQWAAQHGVLNGANLADVLDMMARDGIVAEDGKLYRDGPKLVVDFRDRSALEAALYQGCVKIGVAASQIQDSVSATGGRSGWYGIRWRPDGETDHNTSLCGYGPASFLYGKLGVPVPAAVDPTTYGYLMFTWNSIGFVSRDSLLNVTTEAWVRQPTTAGYPKPPEPQPAPVPVPPQPEPKPEPQPAPPLPLWWILVGEAVVIVAAMGGIVLIARKSAAK